MRASVGKNRFSQTSKPCRFVFCLFVCLPFCLFFFFYVLLIHRISWIIFLKINWKNFRDINKCILLIHLSFLEPNTLKVFLLVFFQLHWFGGSLKIFNKKVLLIRGTMKWHFTRQSGFIGNNQSRMFCLPDIYDR